MSMLTERELKLKSVEYRKDILRVIKASGAGHTGGDLSSIDILNVLYNRILRVTPETFANPDHDYYVQSKGHCAEALFVVLADCGYFPRSDLDTLNHFDSHYIGHPTRKVNGVEQNTGAFGHGLAFAVGVALAGKQDRKDYRVFTLLGDGELAEGSNWEAGMTAAHYRLDNLVAIVDRNGLQITGSTEDVCSSSRSTRNSKRSASLFAGVMAMTLLTWCGHLRACRLRLENQAWSWRRPAKERELALWITLRSGTTASRATMNLAGR